MNNAPIPGVRNMKTIFTAKEIRERSHQWLRFIRNHDRALLEQKILNKKSDGHLMGDSND